MNLSNKDKKNIEKALNKELEKDNKITKVLKQNKGKIKLEIKGTVFIDDKGNKKIGGCLELIETKSDSKLLSGWNLDLGATENYDILAGISKDFDVNESQFSIGGYISLKDAGENIWNKYIKKNDKEMNKIKIKFGVSKIF